MHAPASFDPVPARLTDSPLFVSDCGDYITQVYWVSGREGDECVVQGRYMGARSTEDEFDRGDHGYTVARFEGMRHTPDLRWRTAFHGHELLLVVGDSVRILDVRKWEEEGCAKELSGLSFEETRVWSCALSHGYVAVLHHRDGQDSITVWDKHTGEVLRVLTSQAEDVRFLGGWLQGSLLFVWDVSDEEARVSVYDLTTGRDSLPVRTVQGLPRQIRVSLTGDLLVQVASEGYDPMIGEPEPPLRYVVHNSVTGEKVTEFLCPKGLDWRMLEDREYGHLSADMQCWPRVEGDGFTGLECLDLYTGSVRKISAELPEIRGDLVVVPNGKHSRMVFRREGDVLAVYTFY